MGTELDLQVQIARLTLADAGTALFRQADVLPLAHALGNADVE
jgi:hypothetical protein